MSDELWRLGVNELTRGIKQKEFSSRDVTESCLNRLDEVNPRINAITEVRAEEALAAADMADKAVSDNTELGLLHGVPVTVKGNVDLAGWATVNGCKVMTDNIAEHTSPCIQNWLDAGAIVIGRTNTPEFCCRWETENDVFGFTKNPWNNALTPGGSSGGAASSLATGVTPMASGNDLGGSLRQPAQACGVCSIKPGLGRVPAWNSTEPDPGPGVALMSVEGVMARKVEDLVTGLQVMSQGSSLDPRWMSVPLENPQSKAKVALVVHPEGGNVSQQVASGVQKAGEFLTKAGYTVEEVQPPGVEELTDVWKTICIGELVHMLKPVVKDFCGSGLSKTLEYYTEIGSDFTLEKYMHAFGQRQGLLREWLDFFQEYPLIVGPVGTEPPLPVNADLESVDAVRDTINSFRFTVSINALGLPSAVVPVGVAEGMPQVVQIIAAPFKELDSLQAAAAIEAQQEPITPINPA